MITQDQYLLRRALLQTEIERTSAEIERIITTDDETAFDQLNPMHDKVYDLECQLADLEDEWLTRDWTAADHMAWSLVCANID